MTFKKGISNNGNGGGRPKGSRNRPSKAFVDALAKDFEEQGDGVIKVLRVESPIDYCRLIGSLVPKELDLEVTNRAHELREWLTWLQSPDIVQAMTVKPEKIEAAKVPAPLATLSVRK